MTVFSQAELEYRCRIVANDLEELRNRDAVLQWMGAWDKDLKAPLKTQMGNAQRYLDTGDWPKTCRNTRRLAGIPIHKALLERGQVSDPPPFAEPWHIFCRACGVALAEALRKQGEVVPGEGEPPVGYDPPRDPHEASVFPAGSHSREEVGDAGWQDKSEVGRKGESLVAQHLAVAVSRGHYDSYDWVSKRDPTSDHDFMAVKGQKRLMIEVKSAAQEFDRPFHMSMREVEALADRSRATHAAIWRIANIAGEAPTMLQLKNDDLRAWTASIIDWSKSLPAGVNATGFKVVPNCIVSEGAVGRVSPWKTATLFLGDMPD
ncbi:MAG: hypothetical protein H6747_11175 [Deltaproteobacteria bacterium]|nr:hypothetical protein [Deltaproteobacteria bacterium]